MTVLPVGATGYFCLFIRYHFSFNQTEEFDDNLQYGQIVNVEKIWDKLSVFAVDA